MLNNQRGIVSILTTSFFSILIMVITVGTLVVQTRELRQSTDSDQSIRAYYAAQSGMEEALLKLKESAGEFRTSGTECRDADLNLDNLDLGEGSGLEITCLRIGANNVTGASQLFQEEAIQYSLANEPELQSATITWGEEDATGPHYTGNPDLLPKVPAGHWSIPAVIEMTVYSYPASGVTPASLQARTIFLRPAQQNSDNAADLNDNSSIQKIKCDITSGLKCRATITGFPGGTSMRHVVRFRPRYNGTKYQIEFRNRAGTAVDAVTAGVRIDVTARAGNIYRRIIALADGSGEPLRYGLDYVIMAQYDICKDMRVNSTSGKLESSSLIGTGATCREEEDEEPPTGLDGDDPPPPDSEGDPPPGD